MSKKRKRRGVSLGTMVMLAWSFLVIGAVALVFPKLSGDTVVAIDAGSMLQSLSLSDGLPELSLSDIPITVTTSKPTSAPAPADKTTNTETVPLTPAPTPYITSEPTPTPYAGGSFTLTVSGSINMDEAVRKSGYYSEAEKYDFSEVLSLLKTEFTDDATLVSLENLVIPDKKVSALIAPEAALTMLKNLGADLVAFGFPKAFDQKLEGIASTIEAADRAGLVHLGVYASEEESGGIIRNINGIQVGFLHYTQSLSSTGSKAIKKADVAYAVPVATAELAAAEIAALRKQGAQVVVVSMNWDGTKTTPTKSQVKLAQQMADAGADVIVGTGTGIVQPAVWLDATRSNGNQQKVLCAYSLGSLLSESRSNGGVASMLLHLKVSVDGSGNVSVDEATYTPTYIWRYKQDGKYYYRVVASDQPAPDGMGDEQTEVKNRAYENLKKYLGEESVITVRGQ